jgi:addiction module RelE/StbE family toxin
MLPIERHKKFVKQFKKLPKNVREKFEQKLRVFVINPYSPVLNNHPLTGRWAGCRSVNVTGDYRAIYHLSNDIVTFMRIGTHHQLYGK